MTRARLMNLSERWFRLLQRLYPVDFRDDMGAAVVEAYLDRARDALERGGVIRLAGLWFRALLDSLRNGAGERVRPAASWRRAGNWGRDAELVTRRLLRSPVFVGATVGTLTIGLGMFAVVYTAVQKILIEPMPYTNPDDLYFVWRDYGPILDLKRGALAGTDIAELQTSNGVIEGAVGLSRFWGGIFSVREGTDPIEIAVTVTSPGLFELLGVAPALGRGFAPEEAGPGPRGVIVLAHELWNRLGADPALVGTDVRLNGQTYTVIGVMPPNFTFVRNEAIEPPQRIDAYIPFAVNLAGTRPNPAAAIYSGLIRARQGTSPQVVADAVDAVGRVIDARDFNGRGLKLYPVGLKRDVVTRMRPALLVLGAAGGVLALMLMVNLASVLLARAAEREHEFAVSRALGANSTAIVRATLFEGGLLGLAGGALGALAASWGTRALVELAPLDFPRREAIAIDWGIASVVIAVGGLLGLLAAAAPATWAARASLSSLLAASAVRGGGGGRGRLRRGMIVAQVALSLVLLGSGGLVVRSFDILLRADPGFRPDGVLTIRVRTPPEFYPQPHDVIGFHDRIQSALAAIPGVMGASAASALPLTAGASQDRIRIPGAPGNSGDPERDLELVDVIGVRAGYVEVMGMRLVAGRTFEAARRDGVLEAIIDRSLAKRFFPDHDPLGAAIANNKKLITIVGVVEQARLYDVHQDGRPQMIVRTDDWGYRPLFYAIRTARDPHALLPDVRAAVRRVDSRVAVGDVRTMDEIVGEVVRQHRASAALTTAFALGALLLASMGLFSVVSGAVTRRRHELAVRLALGADHRRVLRLVLGEGALLVGIGVLIGLPGIYGAGRLIRGVLVGVSPSDPLTLGAVALGLLLVTMATCYVPARRALGIDPAQLLREE
jgi:putative ABC transport system permease protein